MEAWTIILALVAVVLAIYYYLIKDLSYFKKFGVPYMEPWPVFGNMGSILFRQKSLVDITVDAYNSHPTAKYVGLFNIDTRFLIIRDPELMKSIAIKNFENFPDHRNVVDEMQEPLLGKNLFSLRGDKWREARTMMSPAFTSSKLKGMFKLMNNCAAEFSIYVSKMPKEKRTFEMKDVFTKYTNDVIATCAFGITINSMKDPKNDFYVLGRKATDFGGMKVMKLFLMKGCPTLSRYLGIKLIPHRIFSFFKNVIKSTIDVRDQHKIVRGDMIQLMMDARDKRATQGKTLDLIEMVAQAFVFFFGGFESVATAMCFTCHELGINPDIQKRLQEEIDRVLGRTDGNPSYEDINNMEYLDAVINECLRKYPIAVIIDRLCVKDFELPPSLSGGKPFLVKKGMNVWFPIYAIHHDPKYFEEPEKLNPDRFIEHGKEIHNSSTFMPFGLGPRICIGNRFALLEMKVLIFHLLGRCNLKPCAKTQIPVKFLKGAFNMAAYGGFWMDIEERNDPHSSLKNTIFDNSAKDKNASNADGVTNDHAVKT